MKLLLHAHSTYSDDGKLTLERLKANAEKRSFDYILLSDHYEHMDVKKYEKLVEHIDSLNMEGGCQILPGYERSWGGFHICAYNVRTFSVEKDFYKWIREVKKEGGLVVQAHPIKYNYEIPEHMLDNVDGIEIWNSKWPYDWMLFPNPQYLKILRDHHLRLVGQDIHKLSDFCNVGIEIAETEKNLIIPEIESGRYTIIPGRHKLNHPAINFILIFISKFRLALFYKLYDLKKKLVNLG